MGSANGELNAPMGITVNIEGGFPYIADVDNHRIVKFNQMGEFLGTWGVGGNGDGQLGRSVSLAMEKPQTDYIADSANNRIQMLTWSGEFLTKWGSLGTADGSVQQPARNRS
ncbi:MAG: hypothetical protein M3T56_15500 [Chloroflexota bacterium]|nr:hypothetical protein [Chloroflexota bacterium]